jgi:alcohol dehydrogenase class IV
MTVTSIPSYDFLTPGRIVFGWGRWPEVGRIVAGLGRRAFVVLGSRTLAAGDFVAQLQQTLRENHVESIMLATITREPEVADVDLLTARIGQHQLRDAVVIAVGGGSAIDAAKAVAALATQEAGSVQDYLEGVGRGWQMTARPLSLIAMPTTAGTGSEATKNAVISSYAPPFKKSLRSDAMMPRIAIVDPQLSVSVPPAVTAQTGMDAITQLIESYISRKARPVPQALAVQGLRLATDAIVEAVEQGSSRPAREAMAQAALLSGMALANSGLGMAHGVAAALGVHLRVPHGLACAIMLPVALHVNRPVCEEQLAQLARSAGLAGNVSQTAAADALVERVDQIGQRIGIPRGLAQWKVTAEQLADLVRDSRGNSMDGNPRSLSDPELTQILEALL